MGGYIFAVRNTKGMEIINLLNQTSYERFKIEQNDLEQHTAVYSLLHILTTDLPKVFTSLMSNIGIDIQSDGAEFQLSLELNPNAGITLIYPDFHNQHPSIKEILNKTTGPVIILSDNGFYDDDSEGRQVLQISMGEIGTKVLQLIGEEELTEEITKEIETLCKRWIIFGTYMGCADLNKDSQSQPDPFSFLPVGTVKPYMECRFFVVESYLHMLLNVELREELEVNRVVMCESLISFHHYERQYGDRTIFIDTFPNFTRYPQLKLTLPNGNMIEIELMIGHRVGVERRIYPRNAFEFQRLKSYLSGWSSRSKYFPEKGEPQMVLYNVIDCKGKTLKDICKLAISEVKDIVSGKVRY